MKSLLVSTSTRARALFKIGVLVSASSLFAVSTLSAQVARPLLDFSFNGSGNTETSTGTNPAEGTFRNFSNQATNLHSGAGGGVSGLPGDLAFDNTASTQMGGTSSSGGEGGQFLVSGAHGALSAFTISGWYKSDVALGNNARLTNGAINIFAEGNSDRRGLTFNLSGIGSAIALQSETGNVYNQANTWTFFAISYEAGAAGQDNTVKFYAGTSSADVYLVTTLSIAGTADNTVAASSILLGNGGSRNRPFDGYMDNFRLWDSALDLDALSFVRTADLGNTPIPEASTWALLVGAVSLGVVVVLRRRKGN